MLITNLLYFALSGLIGVAGTPDDPYYSHPGDSEISRQLFTSAIGIRWNYKNHQVIEKRFANRVHAVVDPSGKYVVAVISGDPQYSPLRNALVFNADGSLLRVIDPPKYVETDMITSTFRKYEPEEFESIKVKDNKVFIGININHDWFQMRAYDIEADKWGEVGSSGRY